MSAIVDDVHRDAVADGVDDNMIMMTMMTITMMLVIFKVCY